MYTCAKTPCPNTFEHPGDEEDCETIGGFCAHLVQAGWAPVYVRTTSGGKKGAWVCSEHSKGVSERCEHCDAPPRELCDQDVFPHERHAHCTEACAWKQREASEKLLNSPKPRRGPGRGH